ncbi:MAG: hypothetical protein GY756_03645 [bacterium]|nr:hypothetical protein [bacterium]
MLYDDVTNKIKYVKKINNGAINRPIPCDIAIKKTESRKFNTKKGIAAILIIFVDFLNSFKSFFLSK